MSYPNHISPLLTIIENGTFWTIPTIELLAILKTEFTDELEILKNAYAVRKNGWQETPKSPSRILYPNEQIHDEINRSLVGVLSLRWINDDDYDSFTRTQPESVRLSRESFHWIRNIFEEQEIINSKDYKLYALVIAMVLNDLGKSTSFVESYLDATGENISHENHDMILHKAAQKGMIPAIERLRCEYRKDLTQGIKLGSEFNVGQLAQAENASSSLTPLLDLRGHEQAWHMRWMEQLLDIAGAAGHENHNSAQMLIEPIFRSYRSVYDIATGIIQGKLTLRQGYDQNLRTRYQLIIDAGWQPKQQLKVDIPKDRALMRLFCMGNVANSEAADLFFNTFYSNLISNDIREGLICNLNNDGTIDRPAIQPTYGPGMINLALSNLTKVQKNHKNEPENSFELTKAKQRTLAALLRYLARVFAKPPDDKIAAQGNVTVIERDIRVAIRDIIESKEFLKCPEILDNAPLPEDSVANRVRED